MCQCDRWGSAQPTEVADIRVVAVMVAVSVHQRATHAKLESSRVSWKSLRPNKLIKFTFCCFINISNQIKTRISIGEVDEEEGIYVSHLWIQILVSQITVPVHGVRILRIRNISKQNLHVGHKGTKNIKYMLTVFNPTFKCELPYVFTTRNVIVNL